MATAASSRATPPASRRSTSVSSAGSPPPSSIHKGATARSAVSPRVSASLSTPARRPSVKGTTSPPPQAVNGETRESLSQSLKHETEKKEQLLVQLQDKEQAITTLKTENDHLTSALNSAESRLAELYADQNRMEEEMAARMEVTEKLRVQVRELEKEKRDLQRRYNEQTATYEAERQAFYDNEQHLKSRIQSLTQARKLPLVPPSPSRASIAESETTELEDEGLAEEIQEAKQDVSDPEQEPAEMTALRLELSTLSTSYTSLQSTLVLLQSQLVDLKRVNNELQEENESYNILLREKTLSGQFDVLKMGGSSSGDGSDASGGEEEDDGENKDAESFRSRNTGRSTLDRVDEAEEHEIELDPGFDQHSNSADAEADADVDDEDVQARNPRSRHSRKRSSVSAPRGESLANLPITGPGLDLAAELGRAENKDILDGHVALDDKPAINAKQKKKGRKGITDRKVSSVSEPAIESHHDLESLRNEVKSLKDANKALSLYASKIIDRIISQEGFEHVLAVDYDKSPTTPATAGFTTFNNILKSPGEPSAPAPKKARPQSAIFSLGSLSSSSSAAPSTPTIPQGERLTTFTSPPPSQTASPQSNTSSPPAPSASSRASRRSMSFDWKSFSMFGGEKKADPAANLRPLTLKAGAPITGARKLDTYEDEDDRRERERLNATMKLMGIEKPAVTTPLGSPVPPVMFKSNSAPEATTPATETPTTPSTTVAPTPSSRFSFFRRSNSTAGNSETSSINSTRQSNSGINTANLTQEALEQAEAEGTLAALDAHERQLSAEIAKGGGGGFTELSRRSGDRRSSRRSGSGSTVWSAGMSRDDE